MSDYDILMIIFIIITSTYFVITNYLICRIDRLREEIYLLEEDNRFLLDFFGINNYNKFKE